MAFGVTSAGFMAKRLSDLKTELEQKYRATFGNTVNLDPRGPFGQKLALEAQEYSLLWELAEAVYNSYIPSNAKGVGVDNALDLVGLRRKNATNSTVDLKYFGDVGTVIDLTVQTSHSSIPTTVFQNSVTGTIPSGSGTDEVQNIAFSDVPDAGDWEITYDAQVTNTLAFNITAGQLQTELENLSNIGAGNVLVTGDFTSGFVITFQGSLAEMFINQITISTNNLTESSNAVTATPSTTTEGELPNITLPAIATLTGPLAAPAGVVTNIVVAPTIGSLDSVTNPLDAELGTNIETDSEAKLRRNQSVAIPGHSTLPAIFADILQIDGVEAVRVFENDTNVEIDGRPPHSFEAVVQGGDQDEIFAAVLAAKATGIQTVGTLSTVLKDSNGFDKTVRFSRPTAIPVYVIADIKTNANFPVDGAATASSNILAYGDGLNIGDDVIVFTQLVCSLDGIAGIIDVDIKLAAAPIPTAGTQVVTFSNVATFLTVDYTAHGLAEFNRVQFSNSGGLLPTGLSASEFYFVRNVTANSFQLSLARTSDPIGFVNSGSGTNTVAFGGFEENLQISDTERADFDSSRITINVV